MKKYLLLALSTLFHLVALGVVFYLTWPIAKWYLAQLPVKGVDIYLSGSYVSHLLRYFAFRFNGWKEFWFSGVPYAKDYPSLYFYLMVPFARHFGLIRGIQVFSAGVLFVLAGFSYLLFFALSKSRVLSVILALAVIYSANLYQPLIWAGGIPFWATQAFLPIVVFLVVKFKQTKNQKWLYLGSLAAGLGILGHPQSFLNVILPASALIFLLWWPKEEKFAFKKRLWETIKFGVLAYLIGLPVASTWTPTNLLSLPFDLLKTLASPKINDLPSSTGGAQMPAGGAVDLVKLWTESQFNLVWSDTNKLLWGLLGIGLVLFLVVWVFRPKKTKNLVSLSPFLLIAGVEILLVFLMSRGINLYIGGWYKAFWPVPICLAILTAFVWGETGLVRERLGEGKNKWLTGIVRLCLNLVMLAAGIYFLVLKPPEILSRFEIIDNNNSAFPDILGVKTSTKQLAEIKDQLKPKLMIDNPHDYRLYIIDATINIWWGALQDVPLTRGYVDPPLTLAERWGIFWLDSVLGPSAKGSKSSLVEDWGTPEWVADNNLYFLLDWYATKYLEGNHSGVSASHFAPNVTTGQFIETEEKIETQGGTVNRYMPQEAWNNDLKQSLNFYRVKKDLVSPILIATNATSVLHIGSEDGYDSLSRFLGEVNLGPRKIILARGPKYIDEVSYADLNNFEAIVLYKYDYRNHSKVWGLLGKYVEKGGKIFVDTGTEVKEGDSSKLPANYPAELPAIFPIRKTVREDLGSVWEPTTTQEVIDKGINVDEFSPLIFDSGPWNISHPAGNEDLRENVQVILRHKGIPVVAERKLGQGEVIWTGYNIFYHAIRDYNTNEAKFLTYLLSKLISLEEKPVLGTGNFISPEKRTIEVNGAKGIIFKEQAFAGWQAKINGRNLKIYKVGPSSPGFIYVRLPEKASGEVRFIYTGALSAQFNSFISFLLILLIFDYLLGGKVVTPLLGKLSRPMQKRVGRWWAKEGEDE